MVCLLVVLCFVGWEIPWLGFDRAEGIFYEGSVGGRLRMQIVFDVARATGRMMNVASQWIQHVAWPGSFQRICGRRGVGGLERICLLVWFRWNLRFLIGLYMADCRRYVAAWEVEIGILPDAAARQPLAVLV